jgi:phospholipid/cholesterol/gamma-HCH transport system substrate-binding protein
VVVGLFVFLGLIFFVSGILMVGKLHSTFKNKMEVVCYFDDVNGLQTGNNVWFSGMKIGTVGKLQFNEQSQVQVSVNIETSAQHHIHKDAKVKISNDGIMGNKILIIYGGTSQTAVVEDGDILEVQKTFSTEGMINTLQENNKNLLSITTDLKAIFKNIAAGNGTLGKLVVDNTVYDNINAATASLQSASEKAREMMNSLATISTGINKKGTLINELLVDTMVFDAIKTSVLNLQQISDTANVLISNLKQAGNNPKSTLGVLLYDEASGAHLRETLKNLESSSIKLDEDLEAVRHNILLRGYFKKQDKKAQKELKQK